MWKFFRTTISSVIAGLIVVGLLGITPDNWDALMTSLPTLPLAMVPIGTALQLYAALTIFWIIMVYFFWKKDFRAWRDKRRKNKPDYKLRSLARVLASEIQMTTEEEKNSFFTRPQYQIFSARQDIAIKLWELGIKAPDGNANNETWLRILTSILPCANNGLIDEARSIGEELIEKITQPPKKPGPKYRPRSQL